MRDGAAKLGSTSYPSLVHILTRVPGSHTTTTMTITGRPPNTVTLPLTLLLLQAGLIALKNPPSTSSSSREDPLQHPDFKALAADLPCAKHVHSKLICAVTREIMNDANPPMVLPNGYVYSNKAIDQIAAKNNGRIVCPHTGAEFGYDEARRAFIV